MTRARPEGSRSYHRALRLGLGARLRQQSLAVSDEAGRVGSLAGRAGELSRQRDGLLDRLDGLGRAPRVQQQRAQREQGMAQIGVPLALEPPLELEVASIGLLGLLEPTQALLSSDQGPNLKTRAVQPSRVSVWTSSAKRGRARTQASSSVLSVGSTTPSSSM